VVRIVCSEDIRYFISLGVPDSLIGKISYALISIVQFIFVQVWKFVVGKLSESVELAAIQIGHTLFLCNVILYCHGQLLDFWVIIVGSSTFSSFS
jgi:hypothetical protein